MIPSTCSLALRARNVISYNHLDLPTIGAQMVDYYNPVSKWLQMRHDCFVEADTYTDVQYVSLVKNPIDTLSDIFIGFGMQDVMTDEYKVIVEQELLKQKEARSKTKLHSYTLDEFGLADVLELPFVKKYHEESRVLLEEKRIY